jgi:hypothetical protein
MRAGPLSNKKVIDLLNSYFVPVYTVNEDYSRTGLAPRAEKEERERIFKAGHAAKKSVGSVHVYVLKPSGEFHDSMHVAEAAKSKKLIEMLERSVSELKVAAGAPVAKPQPQSQRPTCEDGSLTLHLTARSLDGKGAWSEFPVENWVVFAPAEQREMLGQSKEAKVGNTWTIPAELSRKLLTHFYPATENNDVSKNKFLDQKLTATVVSTDGNRARARLIGDFRMEHSFYHKADGKIADGTVIGYMDFGPSSGAVENVQLVTDKATYGGGTFAIAVRSVR